MKRGNLELVEAPIDNKNLMEDPFEDEIFGDFYAAPDHRKNGKRHLIGYKKEWADCYLDVYWEHGWNTVRITVLAIPGHEYFENVCDEVYNAVRKEFSEWEGDDSHIHVSFLLSGNTISVHFFFDME